VRVHKSMSVIHARPCNC